VDNDLTETGNWEAEGPDRNDDTFSSLLTTGVFNNFDTPFEAENFGISVLVTATGGDTESTLWTTELDDKASELIDLDLAEVSGVSTTFDGDLFRSLFKISFSI
jgi:hypothetical protein